MTPPTRKWTPPIGLLWIAAIFSLAGLGLFLPVIPYHPVCRAVYEERIRHSREPQVTPEWAAAIRNWAETDGCTHCYSTGRVSLFFYLHENQWNLSGSRRAS